MQWAWQVWMFLTVGLALLQLIVLLITALRGWWWWFNWSPWQECVDIVIKCECMVLFDQSQVSGWEGGQLTGWLCGQGQTLPHNIRLYSLCPPGREDAACTARSWSPGKPELSLYHSNSESAEWREDTLIFGNWQLSDIFSLRGGMEFLALKLWVFSCQTMAAIMWPTVSTSDVDVHLHS